MQAATAIGLDIAQPAFQIHGDASGHERPRTAAKSLSIPLADLRQFDIVQFGLAGRGKMPFARSRQREFIALGGTETADDGDLG
jgi:hypothetical protein